MMIRKALLCLFMGLMLSSPAMAGFEVTHYPQACYLGDQFTFVLRGLPGSEMTVFLNEQELHRAEFKKELLETNLSLSESGILSFKQGDVHHDFVLVRPSDDVDLTEKDGYLYSGETPAILAASHKEPPPFDRRWFPIRYVMGLMSDTRPALRSSLLLQNKDFASIDRSVLEENMGDAWRVSNGSEAMYEINSLATGIHKHDPADAVAIALSVRDYELGIEPLHHRIKLEWCMQALLGDGFKHIFIESPPLSQTQRKKYAALKHNLITACQAHQAALIDMTSLVSADVWYRKFIAAVGKVMRCD